MIERDYWAISNFCLCSSFIVFGSKTVQIAKYCLREKGQANNRDIEAQSIPNMNR